MREFDDISGHFLSGDHFINSHNLSLDSVWILLGENWSWSLLGLRAYETWKQCQWIMRTLTCKHKIWGKNWLYLRPYLKAFLVFNVLETCRQYFLTIDLGIVEFRKKFIEPFLEKCEIFRHGPNYVQKLYQKQLNAS